MTKTTEERFWSKVAKSDGCWLWTAVCNQNGYGRFRVESEMVLAHRLSYEWASGGIPDGMYVDHRCHNRNCVRPDHLRLVTHAQNHQNRRGAQNNSATGIRGVTWDKSRRKYRAQIGLNGKVLHVGYYDTIEAAEAAVIAKRQELFTHDDYADWSTTAGLACTTPS